MINKIIGAFILLLMTMSTSAADESQCVGTVKLADTTYEMPIQTISRRLNSDGDGGFVLSYVITAYEILNTKRQYPMLTIQGTNTAKEKEAIYTLYVKEEGKTRRDSYSGVMPYDAFKNGKLNHKGESNNFDNPKLDNKVITEIIIDCSLIAL